MRVIVRVRIRVAVRVRVRVRVRARFRVRQYGPMPKAAFCSLFRLLSRRTRNLLVINQVAFQ